MFRFFKSRFQYSWQVFDFGSGCNESQHIKQSLYADCFVNVRIIGRMRPQIIFNHLKIAENDFPQFLIISIHFPEWTTFDRKQRSTPLSGTSMQPFVW